VRFQTVCQELAERSLGKLQAEVRRLQASLEEKRHTRLESSQSIIQDARTRIETFRNTVRQWFRSDWVY